jgi:DNA-binding transcriptional regulator YiaG
MPDIASTLKAEISRIARKEIRSETSELKKSSSQHRSHIAALRRRIEALEKDLKRANRRSARRARAEAPQDSGAVQRRFSSARLAATRKKLGLSAADFAALIGVSGQSIYKWESGEARPRAKQLDAIASVRGMGKREAALSLEALRAAA